MGYTYIHTYVFIDLAAKLAGLWCTIYIKNIANIKETFIISDILKKPMIKYYWKFLIQYGINEFKNLLVFVLLFSKSTSSKFTWDMISRHWHSMC